MTVLDGPPSSTVAWESTPKAPVRMFIADDQPLAVIGIRSICATAKPLVEVVATTDSTSGLLDAPNLSACDVLVLDPQIADRDGSGTRRMALLRAIRSRYRRLPIVVLVRSEAHPSELQSLMRNSYAVFC